MRDPVDADAVLGAIAARRYVHNNEDQLQAALADALEDAGYPVQREVILSPTDRIDLLVDRVGIEVKVKGTFVAVAGQLLRYARSDLVDELVLVTTVPAHDMPDVIGGKPLQTLHLRGTFL
jgi:hypothetical protein